MPELPEVETIARGLKSLAGKRVDHLEVITPSVVRRKEYEPGEMAGRRIGEVGRRGKFIRLEMEGCLSLFFHLGMSGRLLFSPAERERAPHTHAVLFMTDGSQVHYVDPRRFGGLWLATDPACVCARLGPEPLGEEFVPGYLLAKFKGRKAAVKSLLLDQGLVAGIGNIYADEALHRAGIRPDRPAGSLSAAEAERLCRAVRATLEDGISWRGTTFRDYRDGSNRPGGFQDHLMVYGREGQPCPGCGEPVARKVISGRGSHYCPRCQE